MEEKRLKTDLDEVRDIRRKRYLKRNKEYQENKMTYYLVYREDGSRQSTGTVKPIDSNLEVLGWAYKSFDYNIQVQGKQWNPQTLDFDDVAIPKPRITVDEFKDLLDDEWSAILVLGRTNNKVAAFLDKLSTMRSVNIESQKIIDGLNYLVSKGVLADSKVTEILQ